MGKDQAIGALGKSLLEKANEHEKMSEMFNLFKNKLIQENCFHVNYGAKKLKQTNSVLKGGQSISVVQEVTVGFMRDRTFEEEFFLVIESKNFNP